MQVMQAGRLVLELQVSLEGMPASVLERAPRHAM